MVLANARAHGRLEQPPNIAAQGITVLPGTQRSQSQLPARPRAVQPGAGSRAIKPRETLMDVLPPHAKLLATQGVAKLTGMQMPESVIKEWATIPADVSAGTPSQ